MLSTSGSNANPDALYTGTEAEISPAQWEEMIAAVGVDKIEDVLKLRPDDFNKCTFKPCLQKRIEAFQTLLSIRHWKKKLTVRLTLTKITGGIWLDDDVSVLCNIASIIFDVARVARDHAAVVPCIIYDNVAIPYWRRLCSVPAVKDGQRRVLKMTVVFQMRETLLENLFNKAKPTYWDGDEVTYDDFKCVVDDPHDMRYLDMEALVNAVYSYDYTKRHNFL